MRSSAVFIVLSVFASVIFYTCSSNKTPASQSYFLNLSDTVDYVGIDVCKKCHADHYSTYIHTGMGSSFGPASLNRSKARFQNVKPVYDSKMDMYYLPFVRDSKIFIREYRLRGSDTVHSRTEEIKWIVGSGHHTNSHFWSDGDFIYQAPLTFYTQDGKWDLPPGFENTNTGFGRKIDIECMSCHNGMPELAEGSINKFTKLPAGIDCERCHGPGELHVAEKMQGHIVDVKKEADRTIVNPARLPWKLQVDICQRCHLQGNNVLKPGKKFTDFRPGMHLDSIFQVYMPEHEGGKAFYMAGHAERLQMSACFIKSNPAGNQNQYNRKLNLTCITCHNPHISVRNTGSEQFNQACKNCHNETGSSQLKKCSAGAPAIAKAGNNCVSCHMPKSGTEDIPHVTVHDHYIRKQSSSGDNVNLGKAIALYAVNGPKPDNRQLFQAYVSWFEKFEPLDVYLEKAALLQTAATPEQEVHYHYAHQDYSGATKQESRIDAEKTDAWTCYRLGKSLDKLGKLPESLKWYRAALSKMPLNADFGAELGNALNRSNLSAEAAEILKKLYNQQQKHVMLLTNLGAAEMLNGNPAEAKKYIYKAVQLDPDFEPARLYLAELYLKTGKKPEAALQLKEALRINPGNKKAKEMMQNMP
jgi:cytochrome c-type biogenesis protein CcmH/NrfG